MELSPSEKGMAGRCEDRPSLFEKYGMKSRKNVMNVPFPAFSI